MHQSRSEHSWALLSGIKRSDTTCLLPLLLCRLVPVTQPPPPCPIQPLRVRVSAPELSVVEQQGLSLPKVPLRSEAAAAGGHGHHLRG